MEAARRLDEWRVLSKKIPSVDMIPEFVVQDSREGQINLNTSEWLILSKIDGHRSIKRIAAASGLSVFDVAKILYGLIATGLIRLRDRGRPRRGPRAAGAARRRHAARRAGGAPPRPRTPRPPAAASPELLRPARPRARGLQRAAGRGRRERREQALPEGPHGARARRRRRRPIDEAISQIARAASILKGPSTTETLLEQLKSIR